MVSICIRVILFLTSQHIVSEVFPKWVAMIPITIISPCLGEEMKLISEINLVTTLGFSS